MSSSHRPNPLYCLTILLSFLAHGLFAQDIQVTGKVTDGRAESLPGVNIVVQGTTDGTVTDLYGNYSISVPENATLEFTYIGFATQAISVNGRSTIDVSMEFDVMQMEEVVVVGYGTVQKNDLTGSVSVLGEDDLALQPVVRVEAALQGRIPGVVVNQNSGNPGSALKVRIRGINSFSGGNGPLYVIDGVLGADAQSLNPTDIQSISVLKDASAAAIYGSAAANGVIIITTKLGNKNSKASVSVNYQHSMSYLRNKLDLMESWEYMQTINDKDRAAGTSEDNLTFTRREILEAQAQGLGTDWQDVVFQPGSQDQIQLSVNKGSFMLSGAAQWNEGIVTGTKYNRYNLRLNYKDKLHDKVELFLGLANSFEERINASEGQNLSIIKAAQGWAPNLPVYDTLTGDYTRNPFYGPLSANPAYTMNERPTETLRNDFQANGYLKFDLLKGLTFKSQASVNLRGISTASFNRVSPNSVANNPTGSSYSNQNAMHFNWQAFQQLQYIKNFGSSNLDAMVVYEARSRSNRQFTADGSQLFTTDLGYYSAAAADVKGNGSSKQNFEVWSLLGRINYTLFDKFLLTFNARRDENSVLAEGLEGANFFGGAVAYKLEKENFIRNIEEIDELKLRLSYGELGSQSVGFTETIELVGYNKGYSFDGSTFTRGTGLPAPKNQSLTWERTSQWDAGIDLSMFGGRLTVVIDAFHKITDDLHFGRQVPLYGGGGTVQFNAGKMRNKGIELGLGGYLLDRGDLSIEADANFTIYRNSLLDILGNEASILSGRSTGNTPDLLTNSHINYVGEPVGLIWGLIFDGVYTTEQESQAALYGLSPGDAIYRDINLDSAISIDDFVVIGNPHPDFTWGFTTNIVYKNLTLNMVWNGAHGMDILNSTKYFTYGGTPQRDATSKDIINRWTPENQNTDVPGFTTTSILYRQSTQYIEDGSFVKLRNIALKYTLPVNSISWLSPVFAEMSVFLTAQNALVFTKYTGYDPESLSDNGDRAGGFDEGGYPIPRTFIAGLNLKF